MTEHDERMLKAVEKIADALTRIADAKEAQNQAGMEMMKAMPSLISEMGAAGAKAGMAAVDNAMEEVLGGGGEKKPPEN